MAVHRRLERAEITVPVKAVLVEMVSFKEWEERNKQFTHIDVGSVVITIPSNLASAIVAGTVKVFELNSYLLDRGIKPSLVIGHSVVDMPRCCDIGRDSSPADWPLIPIALLGDK